MSRTIIATADAPAAIGPYSQAVRVGAWLNCSARAGACTVGGAAISAAMKFAKGELRQTIEGSCATALVPILRGLPAGLRGGDVLCVLTGRNVDAEGWTSLAPPPAIDALAAALSSSKLRQP